MKTKDKQPASPTRVRDKDRTAQELRAALEGLKSAGLRVSVVAIAEAVRVHPSLVHHVYPEIAKEISDLRRGSGPERKERQEDKLATALQDLSELRRKLSESEASIKTLISRNATLELRVRSLEAGQAAGVGRVLPLKPTGKRV